MRSAHSTHRHHTGHCAQRLLSNCELAAREPVTYPQSVNSRLRFVLVKHISALLPATGHWDRLPTVTTQAESEGPRTHGVGYAGASGASEGDSGAGSLSNSACSDRAIASPSAIFLVVISLSVSVRSWPRGLRPCVLREYLCWGRSTDPSWCAHPRAALSWERGQGHTLNLAR